MRKIISKFVIILFLGVFLACSESREISPQDTGTDYFPLVTGSYSIYQVDGVEYINPSDSTPFSYQLKETVVDSFTNLEGGISYKLLRETRSDEYDFWKTDSVWTARKDNIRAIRVENNVPVVSLVFPLRENKTWDANGLNSREDDEFEMINVKQSFSGEFQSFDKTVLVVQEDIPVNFVNFISKKEVYSENIGLIYKENVHVEYLQGEYTNLGIIESGLKYYQSILEFGRE